MNERNYAYSTIISFIHYFSIYFMLIIMILLLFRFMSCLVCLKKNIRSGLTTVTKYKTYRNLPSWAAAPPAIILVMKILESSPMCGLSVPPAMLKPSPEFPWGQRGEKKFKAQ